MSVSLNYKGKEFNTDWGDACWIEDLLEQMGFKPYIDPNGYNVGVLPWDEARDLTDDEARQIKNLLKTHHIGYEETSTDAMGRTLKNPDTRPIVSKFGRPGKPLQPWMQKLIDGIRGLVSMVKDDVEHIADLIE